MVTICDSPGLVFPVATMTTADEQAANEAVAAVVDVSDADVLSSSPPIAVGVDASPRAIYECCGLFPIAQVREAYSAVRLLHLGVDLMRVYNLRPQDLDDDGDEPPSPMGFCMALAQRKGYRIARGKGALDPHRAGLEVLKDCVDGACCLAFSPPPSTGTP